MRRYSRSMASQPEISRSGDVGRKLRILSLVPFTPRTDGHHGGSRAVGQLLAHLALRHDVAVLHARRAGEAPADDRLRTRCTVVEEVVDSPQRRSLAARVARRVQMRRALLCGVPTWAWQRSTQGYVERLRALVREWQPDVIQLEFHVMGQFLHALDSSAAPRVLVQHEPGLAAATEKGRHSVGAVVRRLEMLAWRRFETAVTREVDAVVVFTERDRKVLEPFSSGTRLVTIPLAIDLGPQPLDPLGKDPDSLLFFGSFRHEPNVDAATRLARAIFPRVRSQRPEATLNIIGSDTTPVVERLAGDGVVVLGEVPDLTPHLDRAGLVVVPLRFGGGMRVKVLEALAAGKAVIASPLAVEGLDVIAGEHVVVAETDQEFVAAATELLSNPSRREAIGSNARAWAEANLSWDARIATYEALYASLLEASPPFTLGKAATA